MSLPSTFASIALLSLSLTAWIRASSSSCSLSISRSLWRSYSWIISSSWCFLAKNASSPSLALKIKSYSFILISFKYSFTSWSRSFFNFSSFVCLFSWLSVILSPLGLCTSSRADSRTAKSLGLSEGYFSKIFWLASSHFLRMPCKSWSAPLALAFSMRSWISYPLLRRI